MKTVGALLWEPGTRSGWSVEDIELDPPKANEVVVKLAASGICHSDDHLDTGDMAVDFAPVLGGHEGAGVIVEVGPGVTDYHVGQHVVLSFLPSCGKCLPCMTGHSNFCVVSAGVISGLAPDGTKRIHARGRDVGAFAFLGTFSPYVVAPVDCLIVIPDEIPLDKAALIGCGVPTGWGSAVRAGEVKIGDTVVVIGTGGVGMNAVQGAKHAGALNLIAVDPIAFKREKAHLFGATHVAASIEEAAGIVAHLTNGQGADVVVMTVDIAYGNLMNPAQLLVRVGGTLVLTSVAPMSQRQIDFDLYTFAMSGKRLQGTVYGSVVARRDIPLLINLYKSGALKLDELITKTYRLEDINEAFTDLRAGSNIRGVIVYDD
ncbi:MAG: NDMA-dependent alcohol dehydrogenase [Subtercola sp.]|nr:NDMA-dependent alcohol dehydrogenase [Subtercola sp.]